MATASQKCATSDYVGSDLGNMAPMREEALIENLTVEGVIPERFRGTFYRNGPNPRFEPRGRYHIFDGDGMIHAIRFTDEGVQYTNRWVRTARWKKEDEEGRALFGGFADRAQTDPLVASWPPSMRSNGNTHTFQHHGTFLALYEGGLPWIMDPVTLETLGADDYQGRLSTTALLAHPHADPESGELIWLGLNSDPSRPAFAAVVIDKDNNIKADIPFDGPFKAMVHDSLFTKDYFIVPLQPLTTDISRPPRGLPYMMWEPELGTQLGILARNATDASEMKWIGMEPCSFFHFFNAFQIDDQTIVIDACANSDAPASVGGSTDLLGNMERWHVDLRTGTVVRNRLFDEGMDFPRIDERRQGNRHRLGIAVGNDGQGPAVEMNIIYRTEPDALKLTKRVLGVGQICSEAVFVPEDPQGENERGYVVTLVLDQDIGTSHLLILDADDIAGEPVAKVHIPKRIPVGFHANWVSNLPGYPQGNF